MAGVAAGIVADGGGGFGAVAEAVEGPLAVWLFDMGFDVEEVALVVAGFVDGALVVRTADLEDEDGASGPRAGGDEGFVGGGRDEDVVEFGVGVFGGGAIGHAEAGGEPDPVAVVGWEVQFAFSGEVKGVWIGRSAGECDGR